MSESSFESSLDTIRKGLSSYATRFEERLKIDSTKRLYLEFPTEEALRDVIGMSFVQRKCLVRWKAFLDEIATQRQRTVVFISAEGQYFAVPADMVVRCKAAYVELQKNDGVVDGAQLRFRNVTSRSMSYVLDYLRDSKPSHDTRVSELEKMSKSFVSEIMNASYTLGVDALCSACREAMKNMFQVADVTDMLREFGKNRRRVKNDDKDHTSAASTFEQTPKPEDKEIEAFRRRLFGSSNAEESSSSTITALSSRLQLPIDLKESLQRTLKKKLRKERRRGC